MKANILIILKTSIWKKFPSKRNASTNM